MTNKTSFRSNHTLACSNEALEQAGVGVAFRSELSWNCLPNSIMAPLIDLPVAFDEFAPLPTTEGWGEGGGGARGGGGGAGGVCGVVARGSVRNLGYVGHTGVRVRKQQQR